MFELRCRLVRVTPSLRNSLQFGPAPLQNPRTWKSGWGSASLRLQAVHLRVATETVVILVMMEDCQNYDVAHLAAHLARTSERAHYGISDRDLRDSGGTQGTHGAVHCRSE